MMLEARTLGQPCTLPLALLNPPFGCSRHKPTACLGADGVGQVKNAAHAVPTSFLFFFFYTAMGKETFH